MEIFIRHLVYDVLAKKTIDKVLKLLRKLDWNDPSVSLALYKDRIGDLIVDHSLDICGTSASIHQAVESEI